MEEQNTQLDLIKDETLPAPIAKNEQEGLTGVIAKDANHLGLRNTIKGCYHESLSFIGKAIIKGRFNIFDQ